MRLNRGRLGLLLTAGLIALAVLLAYPRTAQAGPPAPVDIPLSQPDGTTILARQWGDEHQHGYETSDGYTLLQDPATSQWLYAISDGQGGLIPARDDQGNPLVAGVDDPSGLPPHARPDPLPEPDSSTAPMILPPTPLAQPPAAGLTLDTVPFAGSRGVQPVLVLLVEFSDRKHTYDAATFQHSLFGETGSVRAFYRQASFGKLDLAPAAESSGGVNDGVIGWLSLPMTHPNNAFDSTAVVNAALAAADPYVDFKQFDQNGDNYLSNRELHIVLVAAGYEMSYCGSPCSAGVGIWAHRLALDSVKIYPRLDETYLAISRTPNQAAIVGGGYTIFGEIHGVGGDDHPATIGVMAHEIGHDLSMPDLYDTTNASAGVGNWSIMGGGSWNEVIEPGDSPALPDAWLKWYQGWISPTSGTDGSTINIGAAANSPFALLLGTNTNGVDWAFGSGPGTGEYFLVENRQPVGFDTGLPGCGLLVWHIDETLPPDNNVNSYREHPLVDLEQADGLRDLYSRRNRGDPGDPFPGSSGKVSFGPGDGALLNPTNRYYSQADSGYSFDLRKAYCDRSMPVTIHSPVLASTPSQIFLPSITFGQPTGPTYSGQVTYNGDPLEGALLKVIGTRQDSDGWMSTTITDVSASGEDGRFFFPRLPWVGGGDYFTIRYDNPGVNNRLLRFTCPKVSGAAADRYSCNPNLANVALVVPQSAAAVGMPATFQWTPRSTETDSYILEFYSASGELVALSNPLGYTDRLQLPALPASLFKPNTPYLWTVRVVTPDGEGYAYAKNMVTFSNLGSQGGPALMMEPER